VEVAYFLPFAFRLLMTSPDDGIEYVDGLICFLSNHREMLERDGVLADSEAAVIACCKAWTETFQVRHYGKEACQEKGWQLSSFDLVENSEVFVSLLDSLWRYDVFAERADSLIAQFARTPSNTVETCWFLEFARAERKRISQAAQPALSEESAFGKIAGFSVAITPVMRSQQVARLIQDKELLRQKYASIISTEVAQSNPSYWTDVADTLQLGDFAAGD
jgi:hypothetical protein